MDLLVAYLKKINSEYKISSQDDVICVSQEYDKVSQATPVAANMYSYEKNFYEKSLNIIDIEGKSYTISVYSNITKYAYEIMKSKIDCLTKLPNRAQLQNYLSNIKKSSVIVMCDIDDFKKVNDVYGHQVGDEVIRLLGDLIRTIINKEEDFAGRYGGEEFLLVFNTEDTSKVKKTMDQFNEFLAKYSKQIKVSVSVGIYKFDPKLESVVSAIKKADEALYYVKQHGKNASMIYDNVKK